MNGSPESGIGHYVWQARYRWSADPDHAEASIEDTWQRVAAACAALEGPAAGRWQGEYLNALRDYRFLPGGRILAGAGTGARVTLCNCFVMGTIEDSLTGILRALTESAQTMQQGGGIGLDFSTLRPRGARARASDRIASGPVSFLPVWAEMCDTLASTSSRGGAMMASLRCDHPDILEFVDAKRAAGSLQSFNLSVQVTDAFMAAMERDEPWALAFPADHLDGDGPVVWRNWSGHHAPIPCRVLRQVRARSLWDAIMRSAHETAEPGVLFIDTINRENNLGYREQICTTNPCGELPLPANGSCNLGSINLTRFVNAPFSPHAAMDLDGIRALTGTAVRLLDAVVDVSHYPLPAQRLAAEGSRRIGIGVTGLADALMLLGLHYDSDPARAQAAGLMKAIREAAYEASIGLAREKGPFPLFEREPYLASPFIQRLPAELREAVGRHGVRNSHLLAIAPTGSISLLAGNVTSGIEPAFGYRYQQRVRSAPDAFTTFDLENFAHRLWREASAGAALPAFFVTAQSLSPTAQLAMQGALQPFVDSAISKTVNLRSDFPFEAMRDVYRVAYDLGLKGCTVYRPAADVGTAPLSSAKIECGSCPPSPATP